jgi:hypothetical protein
VFYSPYMVLVTYESTFLSREILLGLLSNHECYAVALCCSIRILMINRLFKYISSLPYCSLRVLTYRNIYLQNKKHISIYILKWSVYITYIYIYKWAALLVKKKGKPDQEVVDHTAHNIVVSNPTMYC